MSTKPEVPKLNASGWEPRLEHFLKWAKTRIVSLEKLAGVDDTDGDTSDEPNPSGILPVYESSRTTLAGTGETEATEDAWTTVASGVPSGARFAIIQFYVDGNADTKQGTVRWRTDSGSQDITAVELVEDYQTKWGAPHFVQLTSSGQFDYIADTTAGAFTWKVYRLGYAM